MRKNELLRRGEVFLRVLDERDGKALVIDCVKRMVPEWVDVVDLSDYVEAAEAELSEATGFVVGEMDAETNRAAHERFTMIAAILPFIGDRRERNFMVGKMAAQYGLSCQTGREDTHSARRAKREPQEISSHDFGFQIFPILASIPAILY